MKINSIKFEKILKKIAYKAWFLFDLPAFVKQEKFEIGIELGAKAGRSMYWTLKANKNLYLYGIDIWENLESSAYINNTKNFEKCNKVLRPFKGRFKLIKGEASIVAKNFEKKSVDYVFFDLVSPLVRTKNDLKPIIASYMDVVKDGGMIIGRDFNNPDFKRCIEQDFGKKLNKCYIGKRESVRLRFLKCKK